MRTLAARRGWSAALLSVLSAPLAAQGGLLERGTGSTGVVFEVATLSGSGLADAGLGGDSIRIRRASQFAIPLNASMQFGDRLAVDATIFYASGDVDYDLGGSRRQARLAGASDARLRATWRLAGDNLLLTFGANVPAGPTRLDGEQQRALRVLASPGLALHAPAVGAGPSGTVGMVAARTFGETAAAVGLSFEMRGTFQPASFAAAGLDNLDYRPGNATRLSLGLERSVGQGQVSLAMSGEVYADDRLLPPGGGAALGTARLGPVLGADLEWRLPSDSFRELALFVSERYRRPLERNGITEDGSSAHYLSGGLRWRKAIGGAHEWFGTAEGRHQTGLSFAPGIATARTTAGSVIAGYSRIIGTMALQPFVKVQAGNLTTTGPSVSFSGFGGGVVLVRRF